MSLGFGQIIIIVIVILLIFGASRLPRIAEDLAKGMKAFKKGLADDDATPGGDDVSAPSHLVRAKPARVIAPAKKAVKSTSHAKKPATNAVVTKTVASKTVSSKSSAAVKLAKTSGTKKSPSKKSVLHV